MKYAGILFFLVISISCASQKKGFGADPDADFSTYKTYAFTDATNAGVKSMNKTRTLSAIENEIKMHGLTPSSNPDLLIDVTMGKNQKTNASKTEVYNPWHFGGWAGFEGSYTYLNVQNNASLIVSLVDAKSNKMVWVGSGTKKLDNSISNQISTKEINKMVHKIFKYYPPKN